MEICCINITISDDRIYSEMSECCGYGSFAGAALTADYRELFHLRAPN
jgi:hypothetical protein